MKRFATLTSILLLLPNRHRLQTRVQHVANSECQLEEKRQHCMYTFVPEQNTPGLSVLDIRVVQAFESALSLLNTS
jgi:hypothetical protein